MAISSENEMVMPVQPMYGGNCGFGNFGGDGWWIILLLLFACGGWGNGFGGFGGGYGMGEFPWLINGQQGINTNTNNGFRDAMLNDGINSIQNGINGISTQLCNGFAGVEQSANARQIADMNTAFAMQNAINSGFNNVNTSLLNCCCENRQGIADLKYTVATENCADRTQAMTNTRDIIESQTRGTQAILDKLCQLELDNAKAQIDSKNERIVDLQNQLNMASLKESQTAQNAFIQQGLNNEVDQLYNRLSNCPVPSTPVYGRTPIFTCNNNNGCGCGCGM